MYLDVFELSVFSLDTFSNTDYVSIFQFFQCFLKDLFLSSDPAHCLIGFLLSVHILKLGTPNWPPSFNAEDLLVLGGLLSVYLKSSSQDAIALLLSLCLWFMESSASNPSVWDSVLACTWLRIWIHCWFLSLRGMFKWRNAKRDWNQYGKQLSLVKQMNSCPLVKTASPMRLARCTV